MKSKLKNIRSTKDLALHDKNANVGTKQGRAMLDTSLAEFGMGRSIVADRQGRIIAGNKTFEAAQLTPWSETRESFVWALVLPATIVPVPSLLPQVDLRRRASPFAPASDPGGSRNGSTAMRS